MIASIGPFDHETIDESPGESNPNPHARVRSIGQFWRYRVVEVSVEVRQRDVDPDAGDVQDQTPVAIRSASVRSVRSHVNSGSVRPKCPYDAVFS